MANRLVLKTRKGYAGNILALCNPKESWSPRFKNDAVKDIEGGTHNYFIESGGEKFSIVVTFVKGTKYLTINSNKASINILGELENC